MHPAVSLLGLLLANDTALLDCVCRRINDAFELSGLEPLSRGEQVMHRRFCSEGWYFTVMEDCQELEPPPAWLAAVGRLLPRDWLRDGGGGGCGGALDGLRRLTFDEPFDLAWALTCRIAADCVHACPVHGLEDIEWNVGTLKTDDLRNSIQSLLLRAVRRITRAIHARHTCYMGLKFPEQRFNKTEYLKQYSDYWRDSVELVSLRVRHLSKLFVPLAFEQMAMKDQSYRLAAVSSSAHRRHWMRIWTDVWSAHCSPSRVSVSETEK